MLEELGKKASIEHVGALEELVAALAGGMATGRGGAGRMAAGAVGLPVGPAMVGGVKGRAAFADMLGGGVPNATHGLTVRKLDPNDHSPSETLCLSCKQPLPLQPSPPPPHQLAHSYGHASEPANAWVHSGSSQQLGRPVVPSRTAKLVYGKEPSNETRRRTHTELLLLANADGDHSGAAPLAFNPMTITSSTSGLGTHRPTSAPVARDRKLRQSASAGGPLPVGPSMPGPGIELRGRSGR